MKGILCIIKAKGLIGSFAVSPFLRSRCRSALRYARYLAVRVICICFRIFRRFTRFARVVRQAVIGIVIGIALRLSAHLVRHRRRFAFCPQKIIKSYSRGTNIRARPCTTPSYGSAAAFPSFASYCTIFWSIYILPICMAILIVAN